MSQRSDMWSKTFQQAYCEAFQRVDSFRYENRTQGGFLRRRLYVRARKELKT
jgi:hypothetical protein